MTAPSPIVTPDEDPLLHRTLTAAGLATEGEFTTKAGWVSKAWIGDQLVVRVGQHRFGQAFEHEGLVTDLLAGTAVPHAQQLARGIGPEGPWAITTRLPGRTLHEAWPQADQQERRSMIDSLGQALSALHQLTPPSDLKPPWLTAALAGGPWPAFHPPLVDQLPTQIEQARTRSAADLAVLDQVAEWVQARVGLFTDDQSVLVHGDLHGSNVMVHQGQVTGLVDFAEAVAQPADADLDSLLRWCARPAEFPPSPGGSTLDPHSLRPVPSWLRGSYPALFERDQLADRLRYYDLWLELSILLHHPEPEQRSTARDRVLGLIRGRHHLSQLRW